MERLGIDIGRVIIGPVIGGRADTSFLSGGMDRALQTPAAEGALEAIAVLVRRFAGRVWLVSKCGARVERKSRRWLDHCDFYGRTGLPRDQLEFCLERRDKAPIARTLGLTHFIDDHLDVLRPMRRDVAHLFLFGEQARPAPPWVEPVIDWASVLDHVRTAQRA